MGTSEVCTHSIRDYDADGRLASWELRNGTSVLRKEHSFDAAGRLTAIADPLAPTQNQAYQYDALDRLTVAQSGNPVVHTQQFAYDAAGNRQNATLDSAVMNLAYGASSNRLQTLTGALPAGYLAGGNGSFTYNNANRLVAASGASAASYKVSALGQRVAKTVNGVTTLFVYDEQGRLVGEYDGSGNLIQETIWLEDLPVATLRPTGTGNPTPIAIYYVHADHLGSPRAISRPADNAVLWRWDNVDPFGANAANPNPSGLGTFSYNLCFPGQYYDAETGTHYNYFRDYDPTVGRYVQSDPVGLTGGINTYSYVLANPLRLVDPLGLKVELCCRPLNVAHNPDIGPAIWKFHCYLVVDGIALGLYPEPGVGRGPRIGVPRYGDDRDTDGTCEDCKPKDNCTNPADCVRRAAGGYPIGGYETLGPNSNTFAYSVFSSCCQSPRFPTRWSTPGYKDPPPAPMP